MVLIRCSFTICLLFFIAIAESGTAWPGSSAKAVLERYEFSQVHMGTRFRIVLYTPGAALATRASDAAFDRIARLDAIMSDYRETSELLSATRRAAAAPVRVSRDLFRVLLKSQEMASRSGGAFDVTIGPVVRLWRHARRTGELPDAKRLDESLALTGYKKLRLDEKTRSIRLARPGMRLDLGGIAKGYAADEAMLVLKRHGVRSALVAAGGDVVVSAPPPGARGWVIGVAPMESSEEAPSGYVMLRDGAVSTSGDAEQYVEISGTRYSHIVDPRTGLGLKGHNSVTVIASNGALSDALATAASVLGPREGASLVEAIPGAAANFISSDERGETSYETSRWRQYRDVTSDR